MNRIAQLAELATELDRRGRFSEADQAEEQMNREANLGSSLSRFIESPAGIATAVGGLGAATIGSLLHNKGKIDRQIQEAGLPPEARNQVLDWMGRVDPQKVKAYRRIHGGGLMTGTAGPEGRRLMIERLRDQNRERPINRSPFGSRPTDRNIDPQAYDRLNAPRTTTTGPDMDSPQMQTMMDATRYINENQPGMIAHPGAKPNPQNPHWMDAAKRKPNPNQM